MRSTVRGLFHGVLLAGVPALLVQGPIPCHAQSLAPMEPSKVVAKVDGIDISQGQVDAVAAMMAGGRPVDAKARQAAFNQIVQVVAIGASPEASDVASTPATRFRQSFMAKVAVAEGTIAALKGQAKVDPAAIQAAYDKYAAAQKGRHWADLVEVVVANRDKAKGEDLAKALGGDHDADRGAALSKQASALGLHPFDMKQTSLDDLPTAVRERVAAAKPGDVVGPVTTPFGATFVVASPAQAKVEPLDSRKAAIEASMRGAQASARLHAIVAGAKVEVLDPSFFPARPAAAPPSGPANAVAAAPLASAKPQGH